MSAFDAEGSAPAGHAARVLAAMLSSRPLAEQARRCGLTEDAFVSFRAAFIAHGLSAFGEGTPWLRWRQLNLRFTDDGQAYRRLAAGSLLPTIEDWLAEGRIDGFFFMNKPPGLRLRLRLADPASPVDLDDLARVLVEEGAAAAVQPAIYEPEMALFGGRTGMDLAHRFFTLDSLHVLAHFRACAVGAATSSSIAFSAGWSRLLLQATVGDRFEIWDVLRKVQDLGRHGGEIRPDVLAALAEPAAERRLATSHAGDLARIGQDLRRARDDGALPVGLRQVVPFWLIFHWNRVGFGRREQADLAATLGTVFDPHG